MTTSPEDLVKAAFEGDDIAIQSLVSGGADVNAVGDYLNPLHAAIENYQLDSIKLLVSLGADIELECLGVTPLQRAIDCETDSQTQTTQPENWDTTLTKLLLDLGANISGQNSSGETALQMATRLKHKRAVELFMGLTFHRTK